MYPEVGWRFNETWATGIMLGYAFGSERGENGREKTHALKLSPFVRYYYLHKGLFNLYLDGGFGYNYITPVGSAGTYRHHGFEVGVRPGVCVDLKHGVERCHTLFYVVSYYLVESETGRLVELFEEIGHEVLQQAILVVELQKGYLMHVFGFRCLELAFVVNPRDH